MIGRGNRYKDIEIDRVRQWFVQTAREIAYDYENGFEVIKDRGQAGFTENRRY